MKILSKKNWEKYQQMMCDLQMDLGEAVENNKTYYEQVEYLRQALGDATARNEKYAYDIDDYLKEIKRLKCLLTKNKIDYKKKGDKNGRK